MSEYLEKVLQLARHTSAQTPARDYLINNPLKLYEIRGTLKEPNDKSLLVCTIWMTEKATGTTKFITMYPDKGREER